METDYNGSHYDHGITVPIWELVPGTWVPGVRALPGLQVTVSGSCESVPSAREQVSAGLISQHSPPVTYKEQSIALKYQ